MNSRQSLLFFCSVLAGLALLSITFPSDGLMLGGGFRVRFPSLTEVMGKPLTQSPLEGEEDEDWDDEEMAGLAGHDGCEEGILTEGFTGTAPSGVADGLDDG